jgi:hypothetical protein
MVSLTRSHPRERVDWACGIALERRSFRYQTLRRLVEQAADVPVVTSLTQEHDCIRYLKQYAAIT